MGLQNDCARMGRSLDGLLSMAMTVRRVTQQLRVADRRPFDEGPCNVSFVEAAEFVTDTLVDVTERLRRVNATIARVEASSLLPGVGRP